MRLRYIVVDNLDDVVRISRMASEPVPVLLRVSPGIQAETDAKMATGHDASKFGIPSHQVDDAIRRIRSEPLLDLRGLHAHVGSQILNVEQFEQAVAALARLERFDVYDLGGGLGIRYVSSDTAPSVEEYVDRLVERSIGTWEPTWKCCSNRAARWSVRTESRSTGSSL